MDSFKKYISNTFLQTKPKNIGNTFTGTSTPKMTPVPSSNPSNTNTTTPKMTPVQNNTNAWIKPTLPPATDLEFHNYNLSHGNTQDWPEYMMAHQKAADYLVKKTNPKTSVEYGCGTGGTLLAMLNRGVMARGLEINPHAVEYFKEHHPVFENQIYLCDFTKEPIEGDEPCDLGLSIEVFEHIDMPERWWEAFIEDLAKKYRYFYFSSTPYKTTDSRDEFWGHKNLRRTTDWIKLFQFNDWDFVENPRILTSWDCLFKSRVV